jgi:peroxiredoxin
MTYSCGRAIGLSAALVLAGAMFASSGAAEQKKAVAKVGAPAPAFSLPDQNGRTVSLSDFTGKIVVLEWFNDECPVVVRHYEGDAMNKLAARYKEKDVVWLAINSTAKHDVAHNKSAAEKFNIERPLLDDHGGTVGHAYGATNTPGMYVIDKQGVLAYMGAIDDDPNGRKKTGAKNYVAQALDELLAGQSVSEPQTKQYGCTVKYAR